jgi:urea transport system substrate-binding protein
MLKRTTPPLVPHCPMHISLVHPSLSHRSTSPHPAASIIATLTNRTARLLMPVLATCRTPFDNLQSCRLTSQRNSPSNGNPNAGVWLCVLAMLACIGCDTANPESLKWLQSNPKPDSIRVGILHSQTGTMAIAETSLRHAEIMAIEEINAQGGVLGRPLLPVVRDGRSRSDIFKKRAKNLIQDESVAVVFGCWTSADRKAVLPLFEQENQLLFYPLQYEGNESSRNVFYFGSTPNQQILPALDWFASEPGGSKKRVFLIGSDYVFPHTANYIVRKYLDTKALAVVGEHYIPMASRDFEQSIQAILKAEPDLILSTINGESNIAFYNALLEAGIDSAKLPVVATSIGEYELRLLLPEAVTGHFSAWSYFQSIDSGANRRFVGNFQAEYGEDRPVDDPMEAAYTQVHLWKIAVEKAGTTDPDAVRKVLESGLEFEAPGGRVRIDPRNHHLAKRFRLGKIQSDRQFAIVYESPEAIAPEPYPDFAFPDWDCDWTKSGLRKGPPVPIPSVDRTPAR